MPDAIPEIVEGLPNLSGWDELVQEATTHRNPAYLSRTPFRLDRLQSAFAIGLHMHQPLILGDGELGRAPLLGNLEYMTKHQEVHGNHDAPSYAHCYSRIADFVKAAVDSGRHPRVMLDYSGELLYGLRQMGRGDILDNLKSVALNDRYWPSVEWLGTLWGHAVVPSTPVPDLKLHMRAWQHHFAAIFGWETLRRVRGFSPPEMHLPNHPDVAFEYVKSLRECGYQWLLVQEHTVEEIGGESLKERYLPRRLVARNSRGEEVTIVALIKTQGSDTKLVGHMQPLHEARNLGRKTLSGRSVPSLVSQISDGENGGVMMNEFPGHFQQAWHGIGTEGVVGIGGTEYLELLAQAGISDRDFGAVQPIHQAAIWSRIKGAPQPDRVRQAIEDAKKADHRFNMDGGSWTNNLSWVRGYESVLDPMNRLSAQFHAKLDGRTGELKTSAYRNALLHLLTSETSCYRYWGAGRWTDFAKEICRRGSDILKYDFP